MSDQHTEVIIPNFKRLKNTDGDDRRQQVQLALELAERKYDKFKDMNDNLKKLNSQLLGLCALSGITSIASQNGTKNAPLWSHDYFIVGCFLLLFIVLMTIIFMLLDMFRPLLPGSFDDSKWTMPEHLTEKVVSSLILRQNIEIEQSLQKYNRRQNFIAFEYVMYLFSLEGILQYILY